MRFRPEGIALETNTKSGSLREFAGTLFQLFDRLDFSQLTQWVRSKRSEGSKADLDSALAALPDSPDKAPDGAVLGFALSDGSFGRIGFHPRHETGPMCRLVLQRPMTDDDSMTDLAQFNAKCLRLCEDLLARVGLHWAELQADGEGECLPEVPMARPATRIAVASRAQVAQSYDDPEAFWGSGWKVLAEHDSQHLLLRGTEAAFGPDFLELIRDDHWAMARAAKPHQCVYGEPHVVPEEEAIFRAGEPRLRFIGYTAQKKLIEYSCALGAGDHIQGWEIYDLLGIATAKKTDDGAPVDMIRIVFLDEWAARQEKRPLLDIGCSVFHYDADGALRELVV